MTDKPKTVAALLDKGYIIGLFQGVSEIGPRALGSRSIIADPRPEKHRDIVNSKIKFREEFRPFAPSVLEEYGKEYFNLDANSPYMQMISEVNDEYKDKLQAVTHINGTARPQTVSKKACEEYYNIIEAFRERTGCAAILNTSFNVKGEPVVHSPTDAIRCFFSTGLDYLVLGDYLVLKNHGFPEVEAEQSVA
nr:carbamoyltransferase C-terminal domain-containing protein [Pseudoalteromonas caenipelagi]